MDFILEYGSIVFNLMSIVTIVYAIGYQFAKRNSLNVNFVFVFRILEYALTFGLIGSTIAFATMDSPWTLVNLGLMIFYGYLFTVTGRKVSLIKKENIREAEFQKRHKENLETIRMLTADIRRSSDNIRDRMFVKEIIDNINEGKTTC